MAVDQIQRRMTAILAADAVGYSRLMGVDEAATHAALKAHRQELIDPKIAKHQGRIVKLTGDGLLAEFPSIVSAVACAEEIQRGMRERNLNVPAERRIEFRIGINLGDVIIDGDDIFGDGVNVAARLEGIAQPGEIMLSATVREHIGNRLDFAFEDMGEQELKNIARPVRAYRLRSNASSNPPPRHPPLGLDDKPSVAVLPFQNMSGDAEQEYFADGVAEDLITALSRFKSFSVIARNSSFLYKGRSVDVRQVGKELGVRYVLEGSVRRAGHRLRITAQLIEAAAGAHLWADKFDGPLEDVFDMQDKITESVVAVVEPRIQQAEITRSRRERPGSLAAYDLYLQAMQKLALDRPEDNAAALELLEKANALEPGYALALAHAAYGYEHRVSMGWPAFSADDAKRSLQLARAALAVAEGDATVLARCGMALMLMGRDYELGLLTITQAVESNPNNLTAIFVAGYAHHIAGSLEEALKFFTRATRLSPRDTSQAMAGVGQIHMCLENYEEGLRAAERSLAMNPNWRVSHYVVIVCNVYLGRMEQAKKALTALQALEPGVSIAQVRSTFHARDPHRNDTLIEGLRRAGMREG